MSDQFFAFNTAASNKNPDLAESSNLFLARFESHTTLSSLYDGALSTCSATRQRLEANPLAVLVDRRAAAAKKQDTDLHLGRVNFTRISADRVLVDEVPSFFLHWPSLCQ